MNEKKAPSERTLRNRLRAIIDQASSSIRPEVAREEYDNENITDFFHDLQKCECQSGFIGSLSYYLDTHAFYDRYYDEIEELRRELETRLVSDFRSRATSRTGSLGLGLSRRLRR